MSPSIVWKLCCCLVVLLAGLAFTPLVIPADVFEPLLFGMPRTLWAGLLIAWAIVGLTCLGASVRTDDSDP